MHNAVIDQPLQVCKLSAKMGAYVMRNLAAKLHGPRDLVWELSPELCGPLERNQVQCRTLYSAISPGTEVAAYIGMPPLRPGQIYPRLVGYCNLAEVLSVGSDVAGLQKGYLVLTHQSHRSGFVCREDDILCVVDNVGDLPAISTAYLFHLGYAALLKSEFRPGYSVAVIGAGTLGLGATAVSSASGGSVTVFSNQVGASLFAGRFGASALLNKGEESLRDTFDIVITTSNSWDDWLLALKLTRFSGTIAMLGFPGRGETSPNFNPLASEYVYDKQITIRACGLLPNLNVRPGEIRFTVKRNMEWLVSMIKAGKLPARSLVSDIVPANELSQTYERLSNREPGLLTAVLKW